jgi:hypothetical protein
MEAAIGIEPINKGFAVQPGPLSLSVMECHGSLLIASLLGNTQDRRRVPTKVPTVKIAERPSGE